MDVFICGHKISYSRSPLIHNYWFKKYQINAQYQIIDIEPKEIERFFLLIKQGKFQGGNFTNPYKEEAFERVSSLSDDAEKIGAVNTVWLKGGDIWGANTDSLGFSASLDDSVPNWRQLPSAVVFGAGGASRAIIHALDRGGIKNIYVINRTFARAFEIVKKFGNHVTAHSQEETKNILSKAYLVINSVPFNSGYEYQGFPNFDWFLQKAVVVDIVYNPLETHFLKHAKKRGLQTIDGTGMLLHQAAFAFEYWFGFRPQITEELHNILKCDLDPFYVSESKF